MPEHLPFPIFFLALPLLAAGWFLLILLLVAKFGGWTNLARCHPAGHRPDGKVFRWCGMQLGPFMRYNNCLTVILAREGIFIAPVFLFRFAHPPLLIPWNRIGSIHESRFLFMKWHCLPIYAAGRRFKLIVHASARDWIERDLAGSGFCS